jgi:hypothetical protein
MIGILLKTTTDKLRQNEDTGEGSPVLLYENGKKKLVQTILRGRVDKRK